MYVGEKSPAQGKNSNLAASSLDEYMCVCGRNRLAGQKFQSRLLSTSDYDKKPYICVVLMLGLRHILKTKSHRQT